MMLYIWLAPPGAEKDGKEASVILHPQTERHMGWDGSCCLHPSPLLSFPLSLSTPFSSFLSFLLQCLAPSPSTLLLSSPPLFSSPLQSLKAPELKDRLEESEKLIQEMTVTWEEKLRKTEEIAQVIHMRTHE